MEKFIVTSKELASVFDVNVRQIQRFTLDGIIEPETIQRPYKYDLANACRHYCQFLTQKLQTKAETAKTAELETQKLQADVNMRTSKAAVAQLELAELEGKMHRAEDVEAIFTDHVLFLRSMLMALPGKLAVDLAGEHTAAEQAETVKKEVYFILNSLADHQYDPEEYRKRVMERHGFERISPSIETD